MLAFAMNTTICTWIDITKHLWLVTVSLLCMTAFNNKERRDS